MMRYSGLAGVFMVIVERPGQHTGSVFTYLPSGISTQERRLQN
jgi:hypothetical protein